MFANSRFHSVVVITFGSDPNNPGSNPGGTFLYFPVIISKPLYGLFKKKTEVMKVLKCLRSSRCRIFTFNRVTKSCGHHYFYLPHLLSPIYVLNNQLVLFLTSPIRNKPWILFFAVPCLKYIDVLGSKPGRHKFLTSLADNRWTEDKLPLLRRPTPVVVKRDGPHSWEPLTRGNPTLALRVSEDSSANLC